jgi:hypothetical protein
MKLVINMANGFMLFSRGFCVCPCVGLFSVNMEVGLTSMKISAVSWTVGLLVQPLADEMVLSARTPGSVGHTCLSNTLWDGIWSPESIFLGGLDEFENEVLRMSGWRSVNSQHPEFWRTVVSCRNRDGVRNQSMSGDGNVVAFPE